MLDLSNNLITDIKGSYIPTLGFKEFENAFFLVNTNLLKFSTIPILQANEDDD